MTLAWVPYGQVIEGRQGPQGVPGPLPDLTPLYALVATAEESQDIADLAAAVQALADAPPEVSQAELDALAARVDAIPVPEVTQAELDALAATIPTLPGQVGADPAGSAADALAQAKAYADALDVDLTALITLAEESEDIQTLADAVQALADAPPEVTQAELDAEAQARANGDTTNADAIAAETTARADAISAEQTARTDALAGKADLVGGRMPDTQVPQRLVTFGKNSVADLDTTLTTGWYLANDTALHTPVAGQFYNVMVISYSYASYETQVAYDVQSNAVWRRQRIGGVWGSWIRTDGLLKADKDSTLGASLRAQAMLTGGGAIAVSGSAGVSWSQRFLAMGVGRGSHFSTSGYFDINMPPNGTVVPGVGGAGDTTVAGGGIQILAWVALYYILPIGGPFNSQNGNFRTVYFNSDFVVPDHWVMICFRDGDNNQFRFGTGISLGLGVGWSMSNPKAGVSLGQVDNVADVNKPVSTAQAAAIAAVTPRSAVVPALLAPNTSSVATTFTYGSGSYFNGTIFTNGAQNQFMEWEVPLDAGTYTMKALWQKGDNGIATISVDGVDLATTIDMYQAGGAVPNQITTITGIVVAGSGRHLIRFRSSTKNAAASAYWLPLHGFTLTRTGA